MINGDANFLGLLDEPSSVKGLTFYQPFERTNDLADTKTFKKGKKFRQLEDHISPAREAVDQLVIDVLNALNDKMLRVQTLPDKEVIIGNVSLWLLPEIIAEQPTDEFKEYLQEKGLTGKLVTAAKRLNTSLSNIDRHILSRGGLFFYTAYRAIKGFEVKDVDGIISNILTSLDKVKIEINRNLVESVIEAQNLQSDETITNKLKVEFSERPLNYDPGKVIPVIVHEFKLIKNQGNLFAIVESFIQNNSINLPTGISKTQLASKMVSYLATIGYRPEPDTERLLQAELEQKIADQKTATDAQIASLRVQTQQSQEELQAKFDHLTTDTDSKIAASSATITGLEGRVKKLEEEPTKENGLIQEIHMLKLNLSNDFTKIEGIGEARAAALQKSKINSFRQLADINLDQLKNILGNVGAGYRFQDFIDQARFIVECDYRKLKELTDLLPRRPDIS